jgi:hypothetical protein
VGGLCTFPGHAIAGGHLRAWPGPHRGSCIFLVRALMDQVVAVNRGGLSVAGDGEHGGQFKATTP